MRKIFTLFFGMFPFNFVRVGLLNLLGHNISFKSKIGFGFYMVNKITLMPNAKIGHLNYLKLEEIQLSDHAFIKNLNYIKGPFKLVLGIKSGIAMMNKIRRAYHPVTYGISELKLGYNTFIVSNNFFDLTRSIRFGDNSQLGGVETQFWTHGYVHEETGEGRIRVDGEINIGNNVYIGSRCLFNPGVEIVDAVNIGGNSVISKDIKEKGLYVNQQLRRLDLDINKIKQNLNKVVVQDLIEDVYTK